MVDYTRLAPESAGRLQPLRYYRGRLYAARGHRLYSIRQGSERLLWDFGDRWIDRSWQFRKVLRRGIHSLNCLDDGRLLVVLRGHLLRGRPDTEFKRLASFDRGRPLRICTSPDGAFFYGEYFRNGDRKPVRIFGGSADADIVEQVYTFPAGSIRHIHGIFWDPWRAGHWVLTGDRDAEAGLWFSTDAFRHVEPVVRGVQQARAVVVFPRPEGIIVPMDSPRETNFVNLLRVDAGTFEPLAPLRGSCMSGTTAGERICLSTAVEPSAVNTGTASEVWVSDGLSDWKRIASFQARWLARTRWASLAQYANVRLAPIDSSSEHLYGWVVSTVEGDGVGVSWSLVRLAESTDPELP